MKKLIITLLLCELIFTVGINDVHAQAQLDEVTVPGAEGKAVVAQRVSDSFDQLFKGAAGSEWTPANKNFIVNFNLNNQKNKAEFTGDGRLLYLIVYGHEKEMPAELRTIVKSTYFDYTINSTVKIKFEGRVFWIINLEDANDLIVLRVEGDNMDVIRKSKKV